MFTICCLLYQQRHCCALREWDVLECNANRKHCRESEGERNCIGNALAQVEIVKGSLGNELLQAVHISLRVGWIPGAIEWGGGREMRYRQRKPQSRRRLTLPGTREQG